ncbi:MAG: NfeD family protein, partial [Oscillospiraceae bacterium]
AELDIGKTAEVIETIDSLSGTGRVRLDGVDWSARSEDGSLIEKGANVTVTASESTTLIVRKKT